MVRPPILGRRDTTPLLYCAMAPWQASLDHVHDRPSVAPERTWIDRKPNKPWHHAHVDKVCPFLWPQNQYVQYYGPMATGNNYTSPNLHSIKLTDLKPNTKYYYS